MNLLIIGITLATYLLACVCQQQPTCPKGTIAFAVNDCRQIKCITSTDCARLGNLCPPQETVGCYLVNEDDAPDSESEGGYQVDGTTLDLSCQCSGPIDSTVGSLTSCNRALHGNDECRQGQICTSLGYCDADPGCLMMGDACTLGGAIKCCNDARYGASFCHQRRFSSVARCFRSALPLESCEGGIECGDLGSECLPDSKVCSLSPEDGCDKYPSMCPPGHACVQAPISEGFNKICAAVG